MFFESDFAVLSTSKDNTGEKRSGTGAGLVKGKGKGQRKGLRKGLRKGKGYG